MNKPIYFMQTDPKWASHNYSAKGEKKTISSSGCGITCSAMVIATLTGKKITPVETAGWSMKHGYKALNQGTYYTYFTPQFKEYGILCRQLNSSSLYGNNTSKVHNDVKNKLQKGNLVIACMGPGIWTSGGHYVLAYGLLNGNVYINDPASKAANRAVNKLSVWQKEVKYYWVVEVSITNTTAKCKLYKSAMITKGFHSTLQKGSSLLYISDKKYGWSKVRYGEQIGYVKNSCLQKSGLSKYQTAKTIKKAYLRKKNSIQSSKIDTINPGEKVTVVSTGKYWANCKWKGKDGFLSMKKLKLQ